ncbi:hypothetical protein PENTCL1PPCAC_10185, partial [Pristionchus entomophagus]
RLVGRSIMEEESSEGIWRPDDVDDKEETTHPMRSSASSEEVDEGGAKKEDLGRIAHISDITDDWAAYSSSGRTPSSSPKTTSSSREKKTTSSSRDGPLRSPEVDSSGPEEEEGLVASRFLLKCYALIVFTGWVVVASLRDFSRALPWLVLDCLVIIYFGGGVAWRALHLSNRLHDFSQRHRLERFDDVRRYLRLGLDFLFRLLLLPICGWIVYDAWSSAIRLRSIGAVVAYVALAVVCSAHPARIKWKPVFGAFTLQLGLGICLLRWSTGREKLVAVANQVVVFLDYTSNGTRVVYEFIAFPPNICGFGFVFLYTAMQIIIYFGGIVSLLYYYGIIQAVLAKFAIVMQYTLGTTVIESLNAVACIFLGQTESAVLIGPAFETMTSSEITTVMCSGFACIAGALFSAYISFGACPEYLLSATVMTASVSLGIAKILYPEVQISSQKNVEDMQLAKHEYHSFFDAISQGAIGAAKVVGAIGMSLVVYLSILSLVNHSTIWLTSRLGYENASFNTLVGLTFYPLAYIMGASDAADPQVNRDETLKVAELMGIKTTVNEFVAYSALAEMIATGTLKGARAQMVATYALCGFSNISSIGAVLGIMSAMCPRRMRVFSKLAVRGLLGGCISCFLTASVAGILVEHPTTCQPKMFNSCLNLTALTPQLDRKYGQI